MRPFDIFMIIIYVIPVVFLQFLAILITLIPLVPLAILAFPAMFYANLFKGVEVYELKGKFKYTAFPFYWLHKQLVEKVWRSNQVGCWNNLGNK